MRFRKPVLAALAGIAAVAAPAAFAPASAQVVTSDPARFIQSLSDTAFGVLRTGDRVTARAKFRAMLQQNFAVDTIGDRLIRRWRGQITPAQYAAYKAALPTYLIGTYADSLYDYADCTIRVVRAVPRGTSAAVLSQVTRPGRGPVTAIWQVEQSGGAYKVSNLTVAGINLSLTQTADFDSYVQRNGFDGLVKFMKSRAAA